MTPSAIRDRIRTAKGGQAVRHLDERLVSLMPEKRRSFMASKLPESLAEDGEPVR